MAGPRGLPLRYTRLRVRNPWRSDIANSKPEAERLRELCEDLQRKTGENADIMRKNGKAIVRSLAVSAASLAISGLALVAFFICVSG